LHRLLQHISPTAGAAAELIQRRYYVLVIFVIFDPSQVNVVVMGMIIMPKSHQLDLDVRYILVLSKNTIL